MTHLRALANSFDAAVDPVRAFAELRRTPRWRASLVLLGILIALGVSAQSSAQNHANLGELDRQLTATTFYRGMSSQEIASIRTATLHPPWWQTPVLAIFQLALVAAALLYVAATLTWIGTLLEAGTHFKLVWSAVVLGAVPSVGLSYVVAGVVALLVGSTYFTTYDQLDAIIPTAAAFVPHDGFLSSALHAVNPFLLWNFALDALILRTLCKASLQLSLSVAATLLIALATFYGISALL